MWSVWGRWILLKWINHLLAPGRPEALEFFDVASVEGVQRINEPLFVRVPQGLQHRMHQLQTQRQMRSGLSHDCPHTETVAVKHPPALRSCKLPPRGVRPVPMWTPSPASLSLWSQQHNSALRCSRPHITAQRRFPSCLSPPCRSLMSTQPR